MMKADPIRKHLAQLEEAVTSISTTITELSEYVLENADEAQSSKGRRGGKKSGRKKKDEGPTAENVREAVLRLIEAKDNDAAKDALGEAQKGAKKVSDLEPENYAAAIEECEAALDADDDEDPTA